MSIGATNIHAQKPSVGNVGTNAHIAYDDEKLKEKNPLSNANLPGGIFTHPSMC